MEPIPRTVLLALARLSGWFDRIAQTLSWHCLGDLVYEAGADENDYSTISDPLLLSRVGCAC
jgi:hypothetical protein